MRRAFILFTMIACAAMALSAETSAILTDLKGKVEVKALGQDWKPAANGMKVDFLTTVSTGFDSTATLVIGKNTVHIDPLTRLSVDKIVEKAGSLSTSLHLRVGNVSAEVKAPAGVTQDFKVTSPYSTASVRGTKFIYNGLKLDVKEGKVAFIPGRPAREIMLPASVKKAVPASGSGTEGAAGTTEGAGTSGAAAGGTEASGGEAGTTATAAGEASPTMAASNVAQLLTAELGSSFSVITESGAADVGTMAAVQTAAPAAAISSAPAQTYAAVYVPAGASLVLSAASLTQGSSGGAPVVTAVATGWASSTSSASSGNGISTPSATGTTTQTVPVVTPTKKTGTLTITWTEGN